MMLLIAGFCTFLVSLLFVWLVSIVAYRFGYVAAPREDRWHKKPTALYGGVGMVAAFFLSLGVLTIAKIVPMPSMSHWAFFAGAFLMFIVGFLDDIIGFKPSTKLIGQIVVVALPITVGFVFAATPWHLVNIIITFFWFLSIINAINIMDNMDGLASGVTMISTMTLIALRYLSEGAWSNHLMFATGGIFFAAILGFWVFNRYPASIFMGDSGSLFLGYLLAGITMPSLLNDKLGRAPSALFGFLLPLFIVSIPLFDTMLVTILRKWNHRPASQGGKDHSSHRLVGLGLSEQQAVRTLYALSALGGLVAIALRLWPAYSVIFVVLYVLLLGFLGVYLGKVRVYPEPTEMAAKAQWTPLFTNVLYKRRIVEVILDFFLIALSYYVAYYLRFEGALQDQAMRYIESLPIVIASSLVFFFVVGVYRGIWHLITISDVSRFAKGIVGGTAASIVLITVLYRFAGYSRSVFVTFMLLLFLCMVGSRLFFRVLDDVIKRRSGSRKKGKLILIYGAGYGGKLLYEECMRNEVYADCSVVGFIDDDHQKQERSISGVMISAYDRALISQGTAPTVYELWISSSKIPSEQVDRAAACIESRLGQKMIVRRFSMKVEELERP